MKLKSFIVTFGSFVFSTALLYLIGHLFTIPWLMFHHKYIDNSNGFFISTGSFTPLLIGLAVSFFAEKIYLYKHHQKLG
ncbi:hypothetical protein [Neobacillus terrae]|uniref:hypothetical protein n=1 Tax=Neobacillus terrae TaxID=3034837 RepID=UPI00140E3AA0|nr:hypothetical protein [Neobacillus terrae]NHM31481.1 hypothetical protein [Neobacillus terrae]